MRSLLILTAAAILSALWCAPISAQAPVGLLDDVTPQPVSAETSSIDGCQVVARIEGQVVLACEVLWKVNKIIDEKRDQIPPDQIDLVRKRLVQQSVFEMVDRKIIYSEFRRNIPAENMPKIEESLAEMFENEEAPKIMKDLGVTNRQDMEKELVRLGSSVADVRRSFFEKAIVSTWVRQKVKINEEISPDEMLTYYRAHQAEYEYPTQARWEELVVRKSRFSQPEQAYAELANMGNEVWQKAAAIPGGIRGPAFPEVAEMRLDGLNAKDGGQYDWTSKGSLKATAIDQALFSLQVGQMSGILESDSSFHIVRVLDRKEAGRKSFADVQGDIKKALQEERFQKAVGIYLNKIHQDARVWTEETGNMSAQAFLEKATGGAQRR